MSSELENTKSLLSQWKSQNKKAKSQALISKIPEDVDIPLSRGQQRLWFLQQLYPNNSFYNHAESYSIKGNLNKNDLFKSLELIVEEHQILKACFPLNDGKAIIHIDKNFKLPISEIDFSDQSIKDAEQNATAYISEEITKPFDLNKGPLIRVTLIKLTEDHHILSLNLHHIIIDEWSMRDLGNLLADYYKKLSNNEQLEAQQPEIEYKDFAHWDINRDLPEQQIKYWKEKLKGELPNLDLQTDFKRPLQPSYNGQHHTMNLSTEDSNNVTTLAKQLGTTPFNVMLSVFYTLLHRYTKQTDILIGLPITNRAHKSLQSLLGFFVDTLVLRTTFNENDSFTELVSKVKTNTFEGFNNKDIPFDYLVKDIQPERSLSMNPFFQVMFVYNNEVASADFGSELKFEKEEDINLKSSKFDLTLFVNEKNGVLSTTFEYATDLFDTSTIERFSKHFQLLVKGIINNSESKLSELPMLTEQEAKLFNIAHKGNVQGPFEKYTAIHHIIEDMASKYPNATAVTYGSDALTYEELNEKANDLAQHILSKKQDNDNIIGLSIERSTKMIVGMLAILKAGCAYLPIDPEYPSQRIEFIIKDAKVNLMVTEANLEANFKPFGIDLVLVDQIKSTNPSIDLPKVSSSDLAYVIYTSGSTGNPKGVPITHQNIINSTAGRLDFYDNNPTAFLLMSSISFDSSKAGIFWTLCTGGHLVISEKRLEQDIDKISRIIEAQNISHTLMLPSLYNLVLEHSETSRLKSLTTVMVAGEACSITVCKNHFEKLPEANLYNEYGPTEATVWCIAHKITLKDLEKSSVPIGKPVANLGIHLLDSNLNPVPYGAVGEIYVSGISLSGHYINRPDLTEAAYFKDKNGLLLYKTGDIGRYDLNGDIEFLGRKDQQIKIRGFRVEIDEIEQTISNNAMINEAVVVVESSGASNLSIDYLDTDALTNLMNYHLSEQEINSLFESIESLSHKEKEYLLDQMSN